MIIMDLKNEIEEIAILLRSTEQKLLEMTEDTMLNTLEEVQGYYSKIQEKRASLLRKYPVENLRLFNNYLTGLTKQITEIFDNVVTGMRTEMNEISLELVRLRNERNLTQYQR